MVGEEGRRARQAVAAAVVCALERAAVILQGTPLCACRLRWTGALWSAARRNIGGGVHACTLHCGHVGWSVRACLRMRLDLPRRKLIQRATHQTYPGPLPRRFAIAVQKAEAAQPSSILPLFGLSVAAATEALPTEPTQSACSPLRATDSALHHHRRSTTERPAVPYRVLCYERRYCVHCCVHWRSNKSRFAYVSRALG